MSLNEETEVAGEEQVLPEVKEPASESPLALEVPRVLEDEARDSGRGRAAVLPEEIDKYVEESLLTKFWTPDVATVVVGGTGDAGRV